MCLPLGTLVANNNPTRNRRETNSLESWYFNVVPRRKKIFHATLRDENDLREPIKNLLYCVSNSKIYPVTNSLLCV